MRLRPYRHARRAARAPLQRTGRRRRSDRVRWRTRGARPGAGISGRAVDVIPMDESFQVPLIVRGRIIDEPQVEPGGRRGGVTFRAPDIAKHLGLLTLRTPSLMADLYRISFEDILDYLVELGARLDPERNPHVQQALRLSCVTSGLS